MTICIGWCQAALGILPWLGWAFLAACAYMVLRLVLRKPH